jgi:hypothetical protein
MTRLSGNDADDPEREAIHHLCVALAESMQEFKIRQGAVAVVQLE